MPEKRLILHVGAPKCGSTALQTVWAHAVEFGQPLGEKIRYGIIDSRGDLVLGKEVRRRATRSLCGTAPSANIKPISEFPRLTRAGLGVALNLALAKSSVLLSQESWLRRPQQFAELDLIQKTSAPVDIVAYVRPQPDFLNASWWQWGAWGKARFRDWMAHQDMQLCHWGQLLQTWAAIPGVRRVYARLLNDDIVGDFFGLIGMPAPTGRIANRSLPGLALRFMQRRRELRPALRGTDMHFVLGNALEDVRDGAPWVLPGDFVDKVVTSAQEDNRLLRSMLDPDSQARMDADQRWWSPAAYAGKKIEPPGPTPMDPQSAEQLASALAKRLLDVERELAELKANTLDQPLLRRIRA